MNEISDVREAISPNETLFVVDSMTGQDAVNTAKVFNDRINFDGVVLTKLDGDTRGGAALSVKYTVNKPIKFVSTGEKMQQIRCLPPRSDGPAYFGYGRYYFVRRAGAGSVRRRGSQADRKADQEEQV